MTNNDWTTLQDTEYVYKDRTRYITVGDLPPNSPEFSNMLPTLHPSPVMLCGWRANMRDNTDGSFHVVPSPNSSEGAPSDEVDTYGNFLKSLEREDSRYANLSLSTSDLTVPDMLMEEGANSDMILQGEELQIYLPSEISPTPLDRLYSTLPGEENASPKTFSFPCLDENSRLENFDIQHGHNVVASEAQCCRIKTEDARTKGQTPVYFHLNAPTVVSKQGLKQRKRKMDECVRMEGKRSKQLKYQQVHDPRDNKDSLKDKPTHNDIERQRRNDMKARFDALKATIPDLEKLERTPKILVLSKATEFIGTIHEKEKQLDVEKEREKKKNRLLLEKLVQLTNL
eukprot:gene18223-20041_t